MKDDDGALLRVEVTDATLDLVSVGRSRLGVRYRERMDLGKLDLDASALDGPELIAAGVEEEPVQPGVEAIGIAQRGQVPPASDERLLDGVLRTVWVPQDEPSRGVQPTDRGACQQRKGVMIASPCSLHEVSLHVALVFARPVWSRLECIGGMRSRIVPEWVASRESTGWQYAGPAMRPLFVFLSLGLLVVLGVALVDMQAPRVAKVGVGSLSFEPEAAGLDALPPDDGCVDDASTDTDRPCAQRFAFAPNGVLRTWVSVGNDGPVPVTLDGVTSSWIDQLEEAAMLARPVVVTDGGDAFREAGRDDSGAPLQPIVLEAGDQRVVGVEFRTTGNVRDACERWVVGSGMVFDSVPFQWHWLTSPHALEVAFGHPVEFMAPTATDCST